VVDNKTESKINGNWRKKEEREGNRGMRIVGRKKSNVREISRRRKDIKKNG